MSNDPISLNLDAILEMPPQSESAGSPLGALFSDGSVALQQASAKVMALEFFIQLLTQDKSFSEFASDLLLCLLRVVKSEAGTIFEVDHVSETLFFRAAAGSSSDVVRNFRIPIGQGVVGHVAESRQPVAVSNVGENRMHLKQIGNAVGFEPRNLIAVPIVIRGKIFGVVELLNRLGENEYTETDIEVLRYLCDVAAKVIEARLMIAWGAQARATSSTHTDRTSNDEAA